MFFLRPNLYPLYMKLKNLIYKYNEDKKDIESKKEEETKEYENSLKDVKNLREEQNKMKEDMENLKNKIKGDDAIRNESINETKLTNELKELKAKNNLEFVKFINAKDLEKTNLQNEGLLNETKKEKEIYQEARKKTLEIEIIKLKYTLLKDNIYNDKEFDELIDLAKQRKEEIINDELEKFKEQKIEVDNLKLQTNKRLTNLKIKNESEIQKKRIELHNHKLKEYNKFLLEKKKNIFDFKNKFSANQVSNEKLKNKEIEKAKNYFDQQNNNLLYREQIFLQQKQNINAFVKQMEMNDDEYSNYLLRYFKKK